MDINASNQSFITDRMTAISNGLSFSRNWMYVAVILLCTVQRVKAIEVFGGGCWIFPSLLQTLLYLVPIRKAMGCGGSVSIYFGGGEEHNDGSFAWKGFWITTPPPPQILFLLLSEEESWLVIRARRRHRDDFMFFDLLVKINRVNPQEMVANL